jgi:VCBS repeat protein
MKKLTFTFVALLALAISPQIFAAGFAGQEIAVDGKITIVVAEDVDSDGNKDLVVSYAVGSQPNAKPYLAVYLSENGSFSQSPAFKAALPKDSCLFDLADLDADGLKEIILFRKWSVRVAAIDAETAKWRTLLKRGSGILFPTSDGSVPYQDLVRDWTGDDAPTIALFDYGSIRFYSSDGKGTELSRVDINTQGWLASSGPAVDGSLGAKLSSGVETPSMFPMLSGERRELVMAQKETVAIHGMTNGRYDRNGKRMTFSVLTEDEKRKGNVNIVPIVEDLNGDGRPELIVDKFGGALTKYSSALYVYPGIDGGLSQTPSFTLEKDGLIVWPRFFDLDGDGLKEMFVHTVDIGLFQIARMFTSQSLKVNVLVFPGTQSGFADTPAMAKKLTVKVDTEAGFRLLGFPPDLSADFDGDGLNDLFMAYEEGFGVWKNLGGLKFDGSPFLSTQFEPTDEHRLIDLSGDGRADFFSYSRYDPEQKGRIVVLITQAD